MASFKTQFLWIILFVFVIALSLIDAQPATCKRSKNFYNDVATKRRKHSHPVVLQNPFGLKSCENANNIILLKNLAKVDFSVELVYGHHKEKAELMFDAQTCPITSFSNDKEARKSMEKSSNHEFFKEKSKRRVLFKTINAPLAHYDPSNDKYEQRYKKYANLKSYISYFIFTLPSGVEKIVEKLKNTKWNEKFQISELEYQMLKSNLIYVGSGRPSRPFEHITLTNYILSGQYLSNFGTQKLHAYLARGVLQKIFNKILIVPFFGSNYYPACLYNEQVTAWTLRANLINTLNRVELTKLRHKLCVERSDPEIYLKNMFSKQSMQFVADYNVEAGIRQIGQFGFVLPITNPNNDNNWKNQIKFKSQPYSTSAFSITKDSTLFYKFGMPFYEETNVVFESISNDDTWFQTYYTIMFPIKRVDFIFKEDDWIERIRLANEIENSLVSSYINLICSSKAFRATVKISKLLLLKLS